MLTIKTGFLCINWYDHMPPFLQLFINVFMLSRSCMLARKQTRSFIWLSYCILGFIFQEFHGEFFSSVFIRELVSSFLSFKCLHLVLVSRKWWLCGVPHWSLTLWTSFRYIYFLFKTLVEVGMNLIDPGIFVRVSLCLNALACNEYIQAIFNPLEGHASRSLSVFPRFSLFLNKIPSCCWMVPHTSLELNITPFYTSTFISPSFMAHFVILVRFLSMLLFFSKKVPLIDFVYSFIKFCMLFIISFCLVILSLECSCFSQDLRIQD